MQSKPKTTKKLKADFSAFFPLKTAEAAYVLGLLVTDGYVKGDYSYIAFAFQYRDRELIDTIKRVFKSTHKVNTRIIDGKKYINIYISGREQVEKLSKTYNICTKKSLTMVYPSSIPDKFFRYFLGGVWIGDGTFINKSKYLNGYKIVSQVVKMVSGSKKFLETIQIKLKENNITSFLIKEDRSKLNKNDIYVLRIKNSCLIDFHDFLFKGLRFQPLKRKHKKMQQIVAYRKKYYPNGFKLSDKKLRLRSKLTKSYIQGQLDNNVSVEQISKKMGVNKSTIYRRLNAL